jgi:hypothetical protein
MGKLRGQRKAKVTVADLDEGGPDLVKLHFNAVFNGDYAALVPLGFACLERGWRATAYAAWYLAVLKDVPEAMPLAVNLSLHMNAAELLAAEEDVNTLLPKMNRHHCN